MVLTYRLICDNISKEDKDKLEREGGNHLAIELNWPNLNNLIQEYNDKKTPEAQFVALLDKLETLMTAKYYTDNIRSKENFLEEFTEYAKKHADKYSNKELLKIKEIIYNF